jgi:hypothetical protein
MAANRVSEVKPQKNAVLITDGIDLKPKLHKKSPAQHLEKPNLLETKGLAK